MEAKKQQYGFIVYLRVMCVLMVAYNHFGAMRYPDWIVTRFFRFAFNTPLMLVQDFGALAVCMFFLISGFLGAKKLENRHTGTFGTVCAYLYGRGKRIFVPLVGTMLMAWLTVRVLPHLFGRASCFDMYGNRDWLRATLLVNHFRCTPDYLNGALWYLVPLLAFYATYALAALLAGKRASVWKIVIFDALYGLVTVLFLRFQINMYYPFAMMPLFGVLLWMKRQGKLGRRAFLLLAGVSWMLMVFSFYRLQSHHYGTGAYLVSFAIGYLIFILLTLTDEKIPAPGRVMTWLSGISYEFYVSHCIIGQFCLWMLDGFGIAPMLSVPLAIAVCTVWAGASHYLIEVLPKRIIKTRRIP